MEVHHHPHGSHEKSWKQYVLECLMIFIAVSMGFIAESIRESMHEKTLKHEYSSSLYNDLKADSVQLNGWIGANKIQLIQIDSLYNILQQPMEQMDKGRLQELIVILNNWTGFDAASGTSSQLISTGGLRLFNESKIPGLLSVYNQFGITIRQSEQQRNSLLAQFIEKFQLEHFTPENMHASVDPASADANGNGFKPVNTTLRNFTKEDAVQFSVNLMLYKGYVRAVNDLYKRHLLFNSHFTKFVKSEAGIKEESH